MVDLRIEVEMGKVIINHAYFLTRTDDAIVLGFDCKTKYPRLECLGSGMGFLDFYLAPKEGCEVEDWTKVEIHGLDDDWRIEMPERFRYEVRVFLFRVNVPDEDSIWINPDLDKEEP